jgi:5-methylcytosine-specific restriction endonuclease McrA
MAALPPPADPTLEAVDRQIIGRDDARTLGLSRYFTGKPCKHGHISERYVSVGICTTCQEIRNNTETKEAKSARIKKWKENNRKRHCELNKLSRMRNIDAWKIRVKRYAQKNPLVGAAAGHRRRARIRSVGGSFTPDDIIILQKKQKNKCINCHVSIKNSFHIDHIMPIALGGTNDKKNIQLLCAHCNHVKYAKHPIEWAQENGRLL